MFTLGISRRKWQTSAERPHLLIGGFRWGGKDDGSHLLLVPGQLSKRETPERHRWSEKNLRTRTCCWHPFQKILDSPETQNIEGGGIFGIELDGFLQKQQITDPLYLSSKDKLEIKISSHLQMIPDDVRISYFHLDSFIIPNVTETYCVPLHSQKGGVEKNNCLNFL